MKNIIHKEGEKIIWISIFSYLILILAILKITGSNSYIPFVVGGLGFILISFLFYFFRNPTREIIPNNNFVLAPADGKIVDISTAYEKEFLKCDCLKISIFMSIWDVHVNRYPLSGNISYSKYHPGKYFIASYPKSSDLNEHHSFVIETPKGISVLVKQIAGALARRVVCYAKVNEKAEQGNDVGFIKFGSRVDLFLPLNAEIMVEMNEMVKGNLTTIALLK